MLPLEDTKRLAHAQSAHSARVSLRTIGGSTSMWWLWLALGVSIAILPVLLSLPFIKEPLGRDQAVYFTVVQSRSMPYASVFDHKPPLIYGWYALGVLMNDGRSSVQTVNLLGALQLSVAALGVSWVGLQLGGRRLGVLAGFLMALAAADQYLQFDANTEVFMLPPLVLSLGCYILGLRKKELRWFCLSGVLCGLAIMTKPVAVFNIIGMVGTLAWGAATRQATWSDSARWSAALIGATTTVIVLVAMPFVVNGTFGDFWHANVTYNLHYSSEVSIFAKLLRFSQINGGVVLGGLPIWTLGIFGAFFACRSMPSVPVAALLASGLGAFAGAASTGHQLPHYFVALTPFAALLSAIALIEMTHDWHLLRRRLHVELFLALLTLPMLIALLPLYTLDVNEAYKITHERIEAHRSIADEEVAAEIVSRTQAQDRIYVVGRETQLYVLAQRQPAAYYIRSAAFDVEPTTFDETMRDLRTYRPTLIIDTSIIQASERDQAGLFGYEDELTPGQRADLNALLSERYSFVTQIQHAKIYGLDRLAASGVAK